MIFIKPICIGNFYTVQQEQVIGASYRDDLDIKMIFFELCFELKFETAPYTCSFAIHIL